MPGVRIRHVSERNVTYTIVARDRLYEMPIVCVRCGRMHVAKTYHIDLDDIGTAIVSETVWDKLQRIPGQPFVLDGEVKSPPTQIVGLNPGYILAPVLEHREN